MPKNIILCSDGTGNAGGMGFNTNVWRIFTAVNTQSPSSVEQVAFYDDGVGSQDYKILRAIGGIFGWGISLNLCQLYAFLMQHYEPGDRIFLFGFSRGAFTIRTLGNMIRYCGVADPAGLSVNGIRERAGEALQAYKLRRTERCAGPNADGSDELVAFKTNHGLFNGEPQPSKDIPIEFIGVWDTVEALGLPVEEMKHGLYYWFRLQFRDGENDMHPRIRHAYHALSIDDERLTFSPTLWDESFCADGQTVEQVWFPGMHANVGGGYAKDQLSLVPLNWMMKKAYNCGLEFHPSVWEGYLRDQDIHGDMADSRAGLGMYYRYAPRDIRRICKRYHVKKHLIHECVIDRIKEGTQEYAPTGVPKEYQIEPAKVLPKGDAERREKRHQQLKIVRDIAWWRRVLYYLMLTWTIALVLLAAIFREREGTPDFGVWNAGWRALYHVQAPLIDLLPWVLPDGADPGLNALRHHPWILPGFAIPFAFFFQRNWALTNKTRNLSVRAWQISLSEAPPDQGRQPTERNWRLDFARWMRDHGGGILFAREKFLRAVCPFITIAAAGLGALGLAIYFGAAITKWTSLSLNPAQPERIEYLYDEPDQQKSFLFDTRNSMQATPIFLEVDTYYQITTDVMEPWKDNDIDTDPFGFVPDDKHKLLKYFGFLRRDPDEPWFQLMAQIGADGEAAFPICVKRKGQVKNGEPVKRIEHEIYAKKSGRLYLFVNDAFGAYHNNQGTATITVQWLRSVN